MTNVDTLPPRLFDDDWARTRTTDPLPSHVAADLSQRTRKAVRQAVLDLVATHRFISGKALNDMYSLSAPLRGWPMVDHDSPRKRAGELVREGLVRVANPDDKRGVPAIYTAVVR